MSPKIVEPPPREKIEALIKDHAKKRLAKDEEEVDKAFHWLRNKFTDLVFDMTNFTFKNKDYGNWKSLGKLLGHPYFKPTDVGEPEYDAVQYRVNLLTNFKKDAAFLLGSEFSGKHEQKMRRAIDERNDHCFGRHKKFCDASDSIVGKYPYKTSHYILITNDPMDIMKKSSGQSWEFKSCERLEGEYEEGIYSDISWSNLIAFLFKNGHDEAIGRVMIRTCLTDNEEVSFGIEPIWYTRSGRIEGAGHIDGINVANVTERIIEILDEKGFTMDYKKCVTPYEYQGYSDQMHEGNTAIEYGRGTYDPAEILDGICNDDMIEWSKCPFCETLIYWRADVFLKGNIDKISDNFDAINGQVLNNFYVYNVNLEWVDDDLYEIENAFPSPDTCPKCKALLFYYTHDTKNIKPFFDVNTKNKTKSDARFLELPENMRLVTLLENKKTLLDAIFSTVLDEFPLLAKFFSYHRLKIPYAAFFMKSEKREKIKHSKQIGMSGSIYTVNRIEFRDGFRSYDEMDDDILIAWEPEKSSDTVINRFIEAKFTKEEIEKIAENLPARSEDRKMLEKML